jgi:hypothetical protein
LYAFSSLGQFFAVSLQPRGHPFFAVWILYFSILALKTSRSSWFILATGLFVFGLYVFLEIAPLAVLFVAVPIMNPRLLKWPVLPAVALLCLLVWGPYLSLQRNVDFIDLTRIVTQNAVMPGTPYWCAKPTAMEIAGTDELFDFQPLLHGSFRYDPTRPPAPEFKGILHEFVLHRIPILVKSLFWNLFPRGGRGWGDWVAAGGLFALLMLGIRLLYQKSIGNDLGIWDFGGTRSLVLLISGVTVLLRLIMKSSQVRSVGASWPQLEFEIWDLQRTLFGSLIWFVPILLGSRLAPGRKDAAGIIHKDRGKQISAILILLALIAGYLTWASVAATESRRFWWLWPVEALIIAFTVTTLAQRLKLARLRAFLLVIPLVMTLANSEVITQLNSWYKLGWSGTEDPIIQLLGQMVQRDNLTADSAPTVSLSYDIAIQPLYIAASSVDRRYRPGMAYDVYLEHRYGIRNEVNCVDGFVLPSHYVIREDRPDSIRKGFIEFRALSNKENRYVLVSRIGNFSLLRLSEESRSTDNKRTQS